jgi:Methylase involved in ubiquinone/menaquinone biosynthesis
MKDNFSSQSDQYAKFRPTYPSELFAYLNGLVATKKTAWDCGTGNGQVAFELAKTFEHVFATDISQSQLDHALQAKNITYSVQPAEKTNFEDGIFDLIVVAQAIHWFDFDAFYAEVRRTGKQNALLAVVGYGRIEINPEIDKLITEFYTNVIGPYWDKERSYIDEHYTTIPFPFQELKTPSFENVHHWKLDHLIGYLNTWSAVKHYIKQHQQNPVENLLLQLKPLWQNGEIKAVRFPILLRVGNIHHPN